MQWEAIKGLLAEEPGEMAIFKNPLSMWVANGLEMGTNDQEGPQGYHLAGTLVSEWETVKTGTRAMGEEMSKNLDGRLTGLYDGLDFKK